MNVISLINFVFAFCFFVREAEKVCNQAAMKSFLPKIGTVFLLWCIFVLFFFALRPFLQLILIYLPVAILFFVPIWLKQRRETQFITAFRNLLHEMDIDIRSGKSVRDALRSFLQRTSHNSSVEIFEIVEITLNSERNYVPRSRLQEIFLNDLKNIEDKQHLALALIDQVLMKVNHWSDFRQRSGQLLLQIRIQVLLLTVLYFSLLAFLVVNYPWQKLKTTVPWSLGLFALGIYIIHRISRSFKWKI